VDGLDVHRRRVVLGLDASARACPSEITSLVEHQVQAVEERVLLHVAEHGHHAHVPGVDDHEASTRG
jgi:hypothetical protein